MQTAYNDAAGRKNPTATELGSGNIGGKTIRPGLYKWSSGVTVPANVVLLGGENSVWIFQIAGTLNVSSGKRIVLRGGAQAKNIFWQVAGKTTIGTTAVFNGTILDKTAIVIMTGARLNGKALSQTAVTLEANPVGEGRSDRDGQFKLPVHRRLCGTGSGLDRRLMPDTSRGWVKQKEPWVRTRGSFLLRHVERNAPRLPGTGFKLYYRTSFFVERKRCSKE